MFPNWTGWKTTKGILFILTGLVTIVPQAYQALYSVVLSSIGAIVVVLSGTNAGPEVVKAAAKGAAFLLLLGLFGRAVVACLIPPTPAQQEQAAAELAACLGQNWGQPPLVVAAKCTGNELAVAEDAIADFEALLEKRAGDAGAVSFPYAGNLAIEAKLAGARLRLHEGQ